MESESENSPVRPVADGSRRKTLPAAAVLVVLSLGLGFALRGCFLPAAPPAPAAPAQEPSGGQETPQIWTCSMHPQIRLPHPGKCPICGMDLIPVVSGSQGTPGENLRTFTTTEAGKKLMAVRTSPVEHKFVTAEIRMVGKVDYDETRLAYITAWVPGRLDRLYVDYTGVTVAKGDHVVYLYSPEILTAQEELRRAASAVANMRSDAPEALKHMAQTTLEATRSKLRRWGLTDEQIQEAENKGSGSDHITIYAPISGTVIDRMGQEGMYVETGSKIYTIADLSEVWVLLDAYETDLPWIHYGQKVEFATDAYPGEVFEGRIAFIDPILNDMTRTVKVRVNVPNESAKLKPEMFVRGVVRAQVATGGRVMDPSLAGKWISPMHPEIVKDKPGVCDICGMPLVRAEDLGYVPAQATAKDMPLVIPATAPLITGKRAVVYVDVPGSERPTYVGREIMLGPRAGDYYIVRSGLEEGELVVTNGNFKIDSSLQILAKPSMMTPDGGAVERPEGESELPFALVEQLKAVDGAYQAVSDAVDAGELEAMRASLKALQDAIGAVDMKLFPPGIHPVWMEYSMRLKDDRIELDEAASAEDRVLALKKMSDTMGQIRAQLGLPQPAEAAPAEAVSPEFQMQLKPLVDAYLDMQSALGNDDLTEAQTGAKQAGTLLKTIDSTSLGENQKSAWAATDSLQLTNLLQPMEKAATLETYREHFKALSETMRTVVKRYGVPPAESLYLVHCPMAFNKEGGNWLQRGEKIRNPYYGKAMPDCGTIVERIGGPVTSTQPSDAPDGHAQHEGSAHE